MNASVITAVLQHNESVERRKNETSSSERDYSVRGKSQETSLNDLVWQNNVHGIIRYVKKGRQVYSWEIENILIYFSPEDAKTILLEVVKHDRTVITYHSVMEAIFQMPEDMAYEIFLEHVKHGGIFLLYDSEDICRKFSKEHAREIMLEMEKKSPYRGCLQLSETIKSIVPELCSK